MTRLAASVVALAMIGGIGAASAQTTRSANIQPGKPVRIAVVTALKKDCGKGDVGSIRIVTAPKNGETVIRSRSLKTPASFRCPNVDTPVSELIYQPKANFQGTDELSYETKDTDGATNTVNVKLNISSKPAPAAPKGGSGGSGVLDL